MKKIWELGLQENRVCEHVFEVINKMASDLKDTAGNTAVLFITHHFIDLR